MKFYTFPVINLDKNKYCYYKENKLHAILSETWQVYDNKNNLGFGGLMLKSFLVHD